MTACPCIVEALLHEGHCCLAAMPDDWTYPQPLPCDHTAEWMAERARRLDADGRAPLPGQETLL